MEKTVRNRCQEEQSAKGLKRSHATYLNASTIFAVLRSVLGACAKYGQEWYWAESKGWCTNSFEHQLLLEARGGTG